MKHILIFSLVFVAVWQDEILSTTRSKLFSLKGRQSSNKCRIWLMTHKNGDSVGVAQRTASRERTAPSFHEMGTSMRFLVESVLLPGATPSCRRRHLRSRIAGIEALLYFPFTQRIFSTFFCLSTNFLMIFRCS